VYTSEGPKHVVNQQVWSNVGTHRENIHAIPNQCCGVYVLFDGSMPLYVGKGHIKARISGARKSQRRGKQWDYFSWYELNDESLIHETEVLLLRILPFYFENIYAPTREISGRRKTS
jgi:hypothetical protein